MKSVVVAAFVLLSASGLSAQERQHASPPHQPSHQPSHPPVSRPSTPPERIVPQVLSTQGVTILPPPPPPSPFDARPGTYAPHYTDPRPSRRDGYGSPIYGGGTWFDSSAPAPVASAPPEDQNVAAPPPAPTAPEPPREPPRVAVAHGPDTFYLIPGCYAGNHPPNPERLPKGCDLAKMRTLPIR
jgi:hypothetical protein